MDCRRRYWGLEDTFIDLLSGVVVDNRDLQTTLNILDWAPTDSYLCLKIRNQSEALSIRSDKALNNTLASQIQGYFSFSYQEMLCVVINLSRQAGRHAGFCQQQSYSHFFLFLSV